MANINQIAVTLTNIRRQYHQIAIPIDKDMAVLFCCIFIDWHHCQNLSFWHFQPVQDIVSQVKSQYGVNFPIFQKVSIVVGETSPLFKYLQGGAINSLKNLLLLAMCLSD